MISLFFFCLIVFSLQINIKRFNSVITVYQNLQIFVESWRFLHLKIVHKSESLSLKEYLAIMHFISFYHLSLLPKIVLKSALSCSHYMSSLQCLSYAPPGDIKIRQKNGKYFQFSKTFIAASLVLFFILQIISITLQKLANCYLIGSLFVCIRIKYENFSMFEWCCN